MPRRLAQQRMTLSDLEWPLHASRAISAIAELLVRSVVIVNEFHRDEYSVVRFISYGGHKKPNSPAHDLYK